MSRDDLSSHITLELALLQVGRVDLIVGDGLETIRERLVSTCAVPPVVAISTTKGATMRVFRIHKPKGCLT